MFLIYLLFSYVLVYERLFLVNHAFSTLFLVLAHLVVALFWAIKCINATPWSHFSGGTGLWPFAPIRSR